MRTNEDELTTTPHRQPISILLADDQPLNIVALEAVLARVDCKLVTAFSGREALKCVLAQDFALILLDIHMPDMDGFETARRIRERERSHLTPIIFLTADDRVGARVLEGYSIGAIDYIYKPFIADILRAKVAFFVELFRNTATLEHLSTTDPLTGVSNRRGSLDAISNLLAMSRRHNLPMTLAILDIDQFKRVNDMYGHAMGDYALREFTELLKGHVRTSDVVGRWGGEEFILALFDCTADLAIIRLERFREALANHVFTSEDDDSFQLNFSGGVTDTVTNGFELDRLQRRADVALYQAKASGRGRCCVAAHELGDRTVAA